MLLKAQISAGRKKEIKQLLIFFGDVATLGVHTGRDEETGEEKQKLYECQMDQKRKKLVIVKGLSHYVNSVTVFYRMKSEKSGYFLHIFLQSSTHRNEQGISSECKLNGYEKTVIGNHTYQNETDKFRNESSRIETGLLGWNTYLN